MAGRPLLSGCSPVNHIDTSQSQAALHSIGIIFTSFINAFHLPSVKCAKGSITNLINGYLVLCCVEVGLLVYCKQPCSSAGAVHIISRTAQLRRNDNPSYCVCV